MYTARDLKIAPAGKGGDPEVVRESQRRRYADVGLVDKVIELDGQWRDGSCSALRCADLGLTRLTTHLHCQPMQSLQNCHRAESASHTIASDKSSYFCSDVCPGETKDRV